MNSILCLDLGTRMGWAIRGADGRILSGQENFAPTRHDSSGVRYCLFSNWLRAKSIQAIDRVFFEAVVAHKGVAAAQIYGGFASILMVERGQPCSQAHYQGIAVGTIKKAATGKGNSSKEEVRDAVIRLFNISRRKALALTFDEADALALLHYVITTEPK